MPIDVFSSLRSTALVTLVAASFSSPIVLKSDAVANVTGKLGGKDGGHEAAPAEMLLAGGIEFEKPGSWEPLGASTIEASEGKDAVGTIVAGLCPGGSEGAECKDGTRVTFVAYTGAKGHELPMLTEFGDQLDAQLAKQFTGFEAGDSTTRPAADGTRYLDYAFTWGADDARSGQRIAAYRNSDGSGVVVMATGPKLEQHAKALDAFLASAHEPLAEEH